MKKVLGILALVFLFVGCGKEKNKDSIFICEYENIEEKTHEKITGNFVSDKLEKVTNEVNIDLNDYLQYEDIDSIYNRFVETYSVYNESEGVNVSVEKEDNSIKVIMEVDYNLLDEALYDKLGIDENYKITSSLFLKNYTDKGYSCKEKEI